ncbi:MAG TPA: RsmE family RNA methyltransferase [Gemmatimonadaceae bacterium]|nr:RsmE family RNA methyltransferase [Gemmatimonadaceae bacterium]
MERDDLASLAGFFSDAEPLARGRVATLGEDAAHHMRVRRLSVGDRVYVADGRGTQATGAIVRLAKKDADIAVDDVLHNDPAPTVNVIVPIADRDRMLWCAEKCAELGATSWRAVMFNRSRSVSPRGEGASFAERLRARMTSALIQSHAPWLPELLPDASLGDAIAAASADGARFVLDVSGDPIARESFAAPVTIVVGPEGGFEPDELARLRDASFRGVSLGANVLRFETAVVAALAIARAALGASQESSRA